MKRRSKFITLILLAMFLGSTGSAVAGPAGMSPSTSNRSFASPASSITIPRGKDSVTVDGFCNEVEYNDALVETFSDYGGTTGTIYLKHTGTDLYICVMGSPGSHPDRFFAVYLDRDFARESWAEADDLGLDVAIVTGARSVAQGTGNSGYIPSTAIGWTAAASAGNTDTAEYRISIRLTNGWCGDPFGLAVYHHWVTGVGDDYGWSSNQWYDQPQTWNEATLAYAPCQVTAYRLQAPPVSEASALQLANLLEGIGGQEAMRDTTYADTSRYTVANETSRAALQQLAASGGFFAFNADEAFSPRPRGTFDPTNAKAMACEFLRANGLFPWKQTPPEARDCTNPNALPYEVNTIKLAQLPVGQGASAQAAQVDQSAVVVKVPLGVNIGGANSSQYIPLTGSGGHLSLLFISTDPQGNAWSLDGQVPGLAALAEPWYGRTLTPLADFPIIGREQAIQQLRSSFPGAILDPGEPELAFYVGDPAVPQSLLMPVWTFPNASFDNGSGWIFPRTMIIPAAPALVPNVDITFPPDGTVYTPGQPFILEGSISGGTGPYTYTWSLEDGTVLNSGVFDGGQIMLTTSDLPAVSRDGRPVDIWVFLEATDSNGVQASDVVRLRPAHVPSIFLPMIFGRSGSSGLARSVTAPSSSIQAIYRVGVEWVSRYNGLGSDLGGTPDDGNSFYRGLRSYGWSPAFLWTDNFAWERDWRDCSLGGIDCTFGVDRAEFVYFAGHGSPARIYFGTTRDSSSFWGVNARFHTVKWVGFASCQTMNVSTISDWFNAFAGGARILLGFHSDMSDINFGGPLVDNMRIPTYIFHGERPDRQRTIPQAWVQTAFQLDAGLPAYLYVIGRGVDTSRDKLPKNGDPAPANPYPIEWYVWYWWERRR